MSLYRACWSATSRVTASEWPVRASWSGTGWSSKPDCYERDRLLGLLSWFVCYTGNYCIGLAKLELVGTLSRTGEKVFLALKRAGKNSWTAEFTKCRRKAKMVTFGCLELAGSYQ